MFIVKAQLSYYCLYSGVEYTLCISLAFLFKYTLDVMSVGPWTQVGCGGPFTISLRYMTDKPNSAHRTLIHGLQYYNESYSTGLKGENAKRTQEECQGFYHHLYIWSRNEATEHAGMDWFHWNTVREASQSGSLGH